MTDAERNAIVMENTGLVVHTINRYYPEDRHPRTAGKDFDDMFQAGMMGLMKGVEKFDASKGFALSTYASKWIRTYISRLRGSIHGGVTLPAQAASITGIFRTAKAKLIVSLGRQPTIEEIVDEVGHHKWTSRVVTFAVANMIDRDWSRVDRTTHVVGSHYEAEHADDVESVQFASRGLSARTRRAIEMRYGLDGGVERTLEEIGNEFGCCREWARKIVLKGEAAMKQQLEAA